jgi:hypothetical protein
MPADATGGRHGTRIRSDRLLLVEGRDEVNLFDALMKHCLDAEPTVQVIDAGGKDRFPKNLRALSTAARARPSLRAIGVVRDADDDAAGAFRSIIDHVRNAGYEPPVVHREFSDATPSIGVFIVPNGEEPGAIETLCRRSKEGDAAAACVDDFLSCLDEHAAMKSANVDKSFAHAYLATTENPVARVGEGAMQRAWNFDSPAFVELVDFLRELAS